MDQSDAPADSGHPHLQMPPDTTTTRPNPFEGDAASSRKRRRTSASASMSPVHGSSDGHDAEPNNHHSIIEEHNSDVHKQQAISTPENTNDNVATTLVASESPSSLDPASQLTLSLRRVVDDDRNNTLQTEKSISRSTSYTRMLVQRLPPREDPDVMVHSYDDTSSSDLEEVVTPPESFPFRRAKDNFHEPVIRLTHYLTTERDIEIANLEMLSVWMQSTIKFFKDSDRSISILTLQHHRKFWLAFPAVMNALTSARPYASESESIISTIQNILSQYSLFTATLVQLDHGTLQRALTTDFEPEDELALYSVECLHIWYDLLYIEERESSGNGKSDRALLWTRREMSRALFSPLSASQGDTTQWISAFACDLSRFSATPKFRLREFMLVVCVLGDSIAEGHRRGDATSSNSTLRRSAQRNREAWLTLSDSLSSIIEKNISILNQESAHRLICALANMFSFVCQSDAQPERNELDRVDLLLESYRLKHPNAMPEILQKAASWEWRLGMLVKLLQSGLMQVRVMAVNMLCAWLADVWTQEEATDEGREYLRHIARIIDGELLGYIVGPSCHPEIILASANIVVFMVVSDADTELLLDRLWSSIESSQDPRVADAITRVIRNTLSVLHYWHLVHLCGKLNRVELDQFSPLLRHLWEALIGEMAAKSQPTSQPLTADPFFSILRVLREVPTCDNGAQYAYPDLQMAAMQRFRDLLHHGLEIDVRKELYRNCVSHLASKSDTTLGSLWFLSICMRPAIASELQYLTETHDIVRLVVEELESAVASASDSTVLVLAGHANQARRDLISQIIHFQPKSIIDDLGARLWEVLVGSKALNSADRRAAWQTISTVGNNSGFQNPFLQICFSRFLPHLSANWYCEGMLNFVKENLMLLVNDCHEFDLDGEETVAQSGTEHLWRIILFARDEDIARSAIGLLASGVYLESRAITTCAVNRAQTIHLRLIRKCLKLMRDAKNTVDVAPMDETADDDSIVVVEPEREILQKKRELLRTLRLLNFFLERYRTNDRYAAADLRSLIPKSRGEMEGEPITLQYQAFGDGGNSEIRSLQIGQENSLASLLAALRDESGFPSYKVYYRGRQFIPTDTEARKSLLQLDMCDGLIILNKDDASSEVPSHVKPGSSPIEIEVLSHFSEFWQYLIMEDSIAVEAYQFLLRLPADGQLTQRLGADDAKYADHFVPDQPFRLLYSIYALKECVREADGQAFAQTVDKALRLLAECLDDVAITQTASGRVKVQITSALIIQYLRFLDDATALRATASGEDIPKPSPRRILSILESATSSEEEELAHFSYKCLSLTLQSSFIDENFWYTVADSSIFAELLVRMCVLSHLKQLRHHCVTFIEDMIKKEIGLSEKNGRLAKFFWSWGIETLATLPDVGENSHELMRLLCGLIGTMCDRYPESIDLEALTQQLTKYLTAHTCTEDIKQDAPCDGVAEGLVILLYRCLEEDTSLAERLPNTAISVLLEKHLFPHDKYGTNESLPRIILNSGTRGKLYECVLVYLRAHSARLHEALQFLADMVPFYADGTEPYIYDLPFQFEQTKALRSPAGYVGLQNLSNTCYLNSLMTQLYMNPDFRNYLLSFDVEENDESKALLHQTQTLFRYMEQSINRSVEPSAFVGAIKTYDQGPIDIHNQMDVDEFYNLLFDRWEAQLPDSEARKSFRSIYGGQLVQQIKSKECGHISERLEPFSAIQCDIKGKSTLEDSLRAYVGGETMDGDNKYKCSSCDRHVDAVKRACLKDVPDNVIFHLKRFEFNLQTLQRSKINDYFAFPDKLDLQPYTIEHLCGEAPDGKRDMFELVGVLVHTGTAESGHYYSYIRERSSTADKSPVWVEFNDDKVAVWNPASMEASTFGGPDRRPVYEENGMVFDKSYSAYMLFYERISPSSQSQTTSELQKVSYTTNGEALKEHIRNENLLVLRRHCLFDPNHAKFVEACVFETFRQNRSPQSGPEANEQSEMDLGVAKTHQIAVGTALNYLDQVFSRSKDSSFGVEFCNKLTEMCKIEQRCAWHVLEYFQKYPAVFRSLLLRNPERSLRTSVSQLFIACLERLSKSCSQLYYLPSRPAMTSSDEDEDMDDDYAGNGSVVSRAVKLLDQLWRYFQHHIRAWDEFFTTVLHMAQLGSAERLAILDAQYLERCLKIIAANRSLDLEPNFMRMVLNVCRRIGTQPTSYVAVLAVIDYLMDQLEPEISSETIVEAGDERQAPGCEYLAWTAAEVSLLLMHPDEESSSVFMVRLLEIEQAPEITKRILKRIIRAGKLPTAKLLSVLEQTIRGDATAEPLDSFIRAAITVVDHCTLSDAQRVLQHICHQAASFQNGEGEAFLDLIGHAMDNQRAHEEERLAMRQLAFRSMRIWVPYLLQYPDVTVRTGTEQLVDLALFPPLNEEGSRSAEAAEFSSELGLAIGMSCLGFLQELHLKRRISIKKELAGVLIRVISNCSVIVVESKSLEDEAKEEFVDQRQAILEDIPALVVEELEEEGSEWDGSALSSERMDEDADTEEALAMLRSNGYQ